MKTLTLSILSIILNLMSGEAVAQKEVKLTTTQAELIVNVSTEKAWEVINSYGDVGDYHSGVTSSKSLEGSANLGSMNCERECTIENGRKDIVVVEKIIEYKENSHYRYEFTRTENFPIEKFYNTFGVKKNAEGKTVIYVKSEFRLDPWFLKYMAKGKLRRGNKDALIAYKHFMETGEKNVDIKILRKKYKNS
jgi:hypothetical protein